MKFVKRRVEMRRRIIPPRKYGAYNWEFLEDENHLKKSVDIAGGKFSIYIQEPKSFLASDSGRTWVLHSRVLVLLYWRGRLAIIKR